MTFDKDKAQELLGKYILVGITYLDAKGNLESQQQLHGVVKRASEREGILIELRGAYEGDEWNMPPDTNAISKADPGTYNLRSTGETVENPDFLCTWEVQRPAENGET